MDEDLNIINQRTRIENTKKFFFDNKKKIIFVFFSLIIILFSYFIYQELKIASKNNLAEQFNQLTMNRIDPNEKDKIDKMLEIIKKKDQTYSTLSLYYLLDFNLISDKEKINKLFDIIIEIQNEKEIKFLNIYKKALYNSDKSSENELLNIISPIIKSKSVWKPHALLLMAEFYFSKNELNKSKEFFLEITDLENINNDIKLEASKRLNRDFSE
tara:strand:+ start:1002 stop:1643 length:642 start_codon:yes stop_codon:yes gene_type:complete